jgi:hypothetical protein
MLGESKVRALILSGLQTAAKVRPACRIAAGQIAGRSKHYAASIVRVICASTFRGMAELIG